MRNLVEVRGLKLRTNNGEAEISLDYLSICSGMRVAVVGGCNSGKTELAKTLAGLSLASLPSHSIKFDGQVYSEISAQARARRVAMLPTDSSLLFSGMRTTVRGELELSLQVLDYGREWEKEILRCVNSLSLWGLLDRDPYTLSGGEQVRVALALILVKSPDLIVLDDVFAPLDNQSSQLVRNVLLERSQEGAAIVECHAHTPPWIDLADKCLYLCSGEVVQGRFGIIWRDVAARCPYLLPAALRANFEHGQQPSDQGNSASCAVNSFKESLPGISWWETLPTKRGTARAAGKGTASLTIENWKFCYEPGGFMLGPISQSVVRGRATAVLGANGSGKTTLLRSLALLLEAQSGRLEVIGRDGQAAKPPPDQKRHTWARQVLYSFQNPDDQLYLGSVWEELVETAKVCGQLDFNTSARAVASALLLEEILEEVPSNLPRPLRRLVTLGSCLAAKPPILLLDEPSVGLDGRQKQLLGRALQDYLEGGGTAILVSHDPEFVMTNCFAALVMDSGRVVENLLLSEFGQEKCPNSLQEVWSADRLTNPPIL